MNSIGMGRKRSRWENTTAVLASLLIHLFFLLGLAYFILKSAERIKETPVVLEEAPQLTLLPMPPAAKPSPRFAHTQPQEKNDRKPNKDAAFESDNDAVAATEAPPSGHDAIPSVDGREEQVLDLTDQRYTAGKTQSTPSTQAAAQPGVDDAVHLPRPRLQLFVRLMR